MSRAFQSVRAHIRHEFRIGSVYGNGFHAVHSNWKAAYAEAAALPLASQDGPPLPAALGHTPSWTSGDVLLWMKRAFGTDPKTRSAAEIRPLNWPNDYLNITARDFPLKRDILLLWARCRAEGASFQDSIRGRPQKYGSSSKAYRVRDEAAAEIAAGINAAIIKARAAVDRS